MKQAKVFLKDMFAGTLTEDDMGYEFRYEPDYLKSENYGRKNERCKMLCNGKWGDFQCVGWRFKDDF